MADTDEMLAEAEKRARAQQQAGFTVAARYDRRTSRVVVKLNTDVQISFPVRLAEGLADAAPDELATIEITPSGLGLHWPKLDADLHVPGLLSGQLGGKRWMAVLLGGAGGRARSQAKAASSRENGRKGGSATQGRRAGVKRAVLAKPAGRKRSARDFGKLKDRLQPLAANNVQQHNTGQSARLAPRSSFCTSPVEIRRYLPNTASPKRARSRKDRISSAVTSGGRQGQRYRQHGGIGGFQYRCLVGVAGAQFVS